MENDVVKSQLASQLSAIISQYASPQAAAWIAQQLRARTEKNTPQQFNGTFTAIPRFTGKQPVQVSPAVVAAIQQLVPGFFVDGWPLDRLVRVWWLLQLPATDRKAYVQQITSLFLAAEMNELAALYSALPVLAWGEDWKMQASEGVRSNIGLVQDAIMLRNPYPAQYLSENAWNQLVMKALFTEKPVQLIIGLDARANAALAATLVDYAHERQAAGRPVNPMQWRMLTHQLEENYLPDIVRLLQSAINIEREAAALVCYHTAYAPAKALLQQVPGLSDEITAGTLSWDTVAARMNLPVTL